MSYNVVLATDGSSGAYVAQELVSVVDWPPETTVHVASVIPRLAQLDPAFSWAGRPMDPAEADVHRTRAAALAAAAAHHLAIRTPDLRIEQHVLRGGAAAAIGRLAGEIHADLIVVGCQGQSGIEGRALGSVAAAIADDSACPVLVGRVPRIGRTLIADDGSIGAADAVAYVRDRPWFGGAATRLEAVVHTDHAYTEAGDLAFDPFAVRCMEDLETESLAEATAWLQADANILRTVGCEANLEVAADTGLPGAALVHAAMSWHADLIVVGSRARPGRQRLFFGSVGRYVVHNAHCSVLLVPQQGPESHEARPEPVAQPLASG